MRTTGGALLAWRPPHARHPERSEGSLTVGLADGALLVRRITMRWFGCAHHDEEKAARVRRHPALPSS